MTNQHGDIPATAGVSESDRLARDAATRRLAACLMVVFALLLGVLTWFSNELNATHAAQDFVRADMQVPPELHLVAPGRTKPGTEAEAHIQAF